MDKAISKVLIMAIVVTLVFSLVACGSTIRPSKTESGEQSAEPVKLTMWHQWVAEADPTANSLKNAIKEWNDKNINGTIQAVGVNGEQYKTKIKTALAAGEAPDLFYMWGGSFAGPYIKAGNILPLDPYLNDGTKDKLIKGSIESWTYDGKIYSLPMFTFIANLYCNKELFSKAGAKIPTTWDELLDAVKALRAAGITPVVVGEKDRWPGMYWFDILAMRQAGNEACLVAMKYPAQFKRQEYLDAASRLSELVRLKAFNDNAFGIGFNEMLNDFTEGKAAMIYQGNWVDVSIEDASAETKGKVVAVPFPTIKDGKGSSSEFFGGDADGFYININTKNREEAVRALKFISEKAGKEGYLNGAGLACWKTDGLDETRLSPLAKQSAELMSTGTSFVGWWDTILPAADSEIHKSLVAELFAGKMTPEEFVREMSQLKGTTD